MSGMNILQSIPTAVRIWKALLKRDSAIGKCLHLMARLDLPSQHHAAREAIATEWVETLPVVLELCEKLPTRTKAIREYIKILPILIQISRNLPEGDSIFVQKFGDVSGHAVIREDYLVDLAKGKRVLHFGFLDAPFSEERIHGGELLHLKIKNAARHLYGIDSDRASLVRYRELTGDQDNELADIQQGLPESLEGQAYDLILLPEILEHLGNPAQALMYLKRLCTRNRGAQLCVTVPNAYYAGVFLRALDAEEIVHPEHYYYFSPATLRRLLRDAGFAVVAMAVYGSRDSAALPGITKNGVIALCEVA